ncbi:Uncharacterized protein BP5553_08792 [Venustampulla echinocandica]|uniref:Six-hairpin glycosidase n=1 Tax=Venustampulla echinocandica TaxID=2656787 RepID=A0A370TF92_9HELO|nr:Uncharacterized protein BP5553_08792 [Venustampulla echinocandica]RDL33353.1 Uncharacterized protein BP5553_08792 [Venustampulla echinocandica]
MTISQRQECMKHGLSELYSESITAKLLRAGVEQLLENNPPTQYPETVPQSGVDKGRYQAREVDFWTCGFFPGCIYSLVERSIKYPQSLGVDNSRVSLNVLRQKLTELGQTWSQPIRPQALRTDTHDLGFVIMPHMRPRWELFHDVEALDVIVKAAESLHSRYDPRVQAIRSWDTFDWHADVNITSMEENFIVIIDSMCNMDLLFYAAAQSGNQSLADAAVKHSRTLLQSHLRVEEYTRNGYSGNLYSTAHLVNFSPLTGTVKEARTAQGYSKDSTWSRGQAWGILGYAQVYRWSGHSEFLDAACGLAEYFLFRMEEAPDCVEVELSGLQGRRVGRYVPLWDFDAPIEEPQGPLRDASAAVIAADGMLILSQALAGCGKHRLSARYLEAAMVIVQDVLDLCLSREKAGLSVSEQGELTVHDLLHGESFDSVLKHSTVCNNAASFKRNKAQDHGLVYADYYLLDFGTRLLEMGICYY